MPILPILVLLAGLTLVPPAFGHDASLAGQHATAKAAIDARPLDRPARNGLFACGMARMTPASSRPWLAADGTVSFAAKPAVPGSVVFRQAEIAMMSGKDGQRLRGNGLPVHETGNFPIARGTPAAIWDRNPNPVRPYKLAFDLSADPQPAAAPSCLPMGPIGVALSGAVFFSALDGEGRDAVAQELMDGCEGHPGPNGQYHYHHGSPCFDNGMPGQHSPLIGLALDGFGIYGPRDEGGVEIGNDALDECHGHLGPVPMADGTTRLVYHYHANNEFPYTLGCFRGTPGDGRGQPQPAMGVSLSPSPPPAAGGPPSPGGGAGGPPADGPRAGGPPAGGPPPGAPRAAMGAGGPPPDKPPPDKPPPDRPQSDGSTPRPPS